MPTDTASTRPTRAVLGAIALLVLGVVLPIFLVLRGSRIDPEPPPGPDGSVVPEFATSSVNVAVRYSLDRLRHDLAAAIPESFGDLSERHSNPTYPALSYAVEARREGLGLEARGDLLHVTSVLGYDGRVWLGTPFGSELGTSCETNGPSDRMPRARLELSTPVALEPGWRIRTDVQVVAVEPMSAEEHCRLSIPPFSLDATDLVMELIRARLEESTTELDSLLASIDVRSRIDEQWHRMREPVRLADDVWLLLDPLLIRRGTVGVGSGGEGAIELGLSLLARPRVVVGERPSSAGSPSPILEEGPVDEEFTLHVETRVDYAAASRLLDRNLRGREFLVGERTVRITDALVLPTSEGRLGVELGVGGAARGRLYLVGRPALDPALGVITVPDLRFSAATRNVLLRAAVWLVDAAFAERVRRHARWSVEEAVTHARSRAAEGLNGPLAPGVRLSGDVTQLSLQGVEARHDAILVRASLQGTASVELGPE